MSRTGNEGGTRGQGGSDAGAGGGGAAEQLRNKATEVSQNIREMGDAAREKYDQLRSSATDYYEQGRARAQEWEQGLEEYVREKPMKSLLIAAGVGMLLGVLWRRS